MSRLNDTIKLIVMLGNVVFTLLSVFFGVGSSLVLSGRIVALDFPAARSTSAGILLISVSVFLCTCFGCCGAVNQVLRKGTCSGRRILSIHQLVLISLLVFSISQYALQSRRLHSITMVVSDMDQYPSYDSFEKRVSFYFNSAYFESICTARAPVDSWMLDWVDAHCPDTMKHEECGPASEKNACGGDASTCPAPLWSPSSCCPSEPICNEGEIAACPYHQCRRPALERVQSWLRPIVACIQAVTFLSGIMIVFTCLLICYNPKDDLEHELIKAGVMTESEIEFIKKRTSQIKLTRESVNSQPGLVASSLSMRNRGKHGRRVSVRIRGRHGCRVSPTREDATPV